MDTGSIVPFVSPLPSFTIFDVETTGLDPRRGDKIIEIAGVRCENGVAHEDTAFRELVNPEREIPVEARHIHRITEAEVLSSPTIDQVLPRFLEFSAGTILIAHNAEFDMRFLRVEKELCWGYVDLPECLCTMELSRSLFPKEFRHTLDAVATRLGIPVPPLRHRALPDVLLTAAAFLKLLEVGKITSLDELKRRAGQKQLVA